jgi:hypothetical protein
LPAAIPKGLTVQRKSMLRHDVPIAFFVSALRLTFGCHAMKQKMLPQAEALIFFGREEGIRTCPSKPAQLLVYYIFKFQIAIKMPQFSISLSTYKHYSSTKQIYTKDGSQTYLRYSALRLTFQNLNFYYPTILPS